MFRILIFSSLFFAALASNVIPQDNDVIENDRATNFNPDRQLVYHLYTRDNPTQSQPILHGNTGLLRLISYDPKKRTIILLPGDRDSDFADILIPAFLEVEDVNIILVDWSRGGSSIYLTAIRNTIAAGGSVARFINWLNEVTGATADQYHIVGHGHGGHMAGIVGRNVDGEVAYITGLDPSNYGWMINRDKFRPNDGKYTEVIHTSAGIFGYLMTLADVDFYPNGGVDQPGCNGALCCHERSIHFFAESLRSRGFTGTRCLSYITAMIGNCGLRGNLQMGGILPKTGSRGIFHMNTRNRAPFSLG